MVNILWTVGHRLPLSLSNWFLISMSPKVLKFSPFYFCMFVCWDHEVPGEECEDLSLYSHISLGSTSQQTVEQPKWVWDALGTHKDILDPCCPTASAVGGHWHHGGAAWPGWAVAVTRHHPEQESLGLPGGRAEELMEQRHTEEGVVDPGAFLSSASGVPVKPCAEGYGIYQAHPLACWAQDKGTISSQSRGHCHMATPPGCNSAFLSNELMPPQKSLHVSLPEFCVPTGRLSSHFSQ